MTDRHERGPTCSALSRNRAEPLVATAARADIWFLLEYPGTWGAKAFPESRIPEATKAHLSAAVEAIPNARLQLIKKRASFSGPGIAFFVAVARELDPALYEFQLERYEDLTDLRLDRAVSGHPSYEPFGRKEPLFLVCTNGKRDPCCARYGLPVFRALRDRWRPQVWQCSHVGGHRFAANLLCLPHGIYYGRLSPGEAHRTVAYYRESKIDLERYRGRSSYDPVVQAADAFLRAQTGMVDLNAFRLEGQREHSPNRWAVRFRSSEAGNLYEVRLRISHSEVGHTVSCQSDKREPVMTCTLDAP